MYEVAALARASSHFSSCERDETVWREEAFKSDPAAKFILAKDGRVLDTNNAANRLVAEQVFTITDGMLRLGATDSNRMLMDSVRQVIARQAGQLRIIVRDRMGAWRAAELYRVDGVDAVFLTFRLTAAEGNSGLEALQSNFGLSSSESRVLEGLLAGDCAKEVARILSVSEHTVRSHMRTIYAKLGVRGLTGALRFALQLTC